MKKNVLLLLVLLLPSANISAQNWLNLCPPGKLLFLNSTNTFAGFRYDSVHKTGNNDSLFFSFPRILKIPGVGPYDTSAGSILGRTILKKNNGWFLVTNYLGDTLKINPPAQLNQNWQFAVLPNAGHMQALVSGTGLQTILGANDSVKTIVLQAYDSLNNPIPHPMNNRQIGVSKHHGILQTFDLYLFPLTSADYTLAGTTNPQAGIQPLSDKDIYHFSAGDIFHFTTLQESQFGHNINTYGKIIRTVLSATWTADSSSVTYLVHDCMRTISNSHNYLFYDTTYSDTNDTLEYSLSPNGGYVLPNEFKTRNVCPGVYNAPLYQLSLNMYIPGRQGSTTDNYYYVKGPQTGNQWALGPYPTPCYIKSAEQYVSGLGQTQGSNAWPGESSSHYQVYANQQGVTYGAPLAEDCAHLHPYVETGADTLSFMFTAGDLDTLAIFSNMSWTITMPGADWIGVNRTHGYGNGYLLFTTLLENPSHEPRTVFAVVNGTGVPAITLTIIQAGSPGAPFFNSTPDTLRLPFNAAKADTLHIFSNIAWSLDWTGVNWLGVNKIQGTGDDFLVFTTLQENPDFTDRTANATVGSNQATWNTLTLIQSGKPGGTDERNGKQLRVSPNPVKDMATITVPGISPGEHMAYSMFDYLGREAIKGTFSGGSMVFHRDGLPSGVYILRISDQEGQFFITTKLLLTFSN